MSIAYQVRYVIPGIGDDVTPSSAIWRSPLPQKRQGDKIEDTLWCYGDYFNAIYAFLQQHESRVLKDLIARIAPSEPLGELVVILVKHGEYYHPAKLELWFGGCLGRAFVLNVAVSQAGRALMAQEHGALQKLAKARQPAYIPTVYGYDTGEWQGLDAKERPFSIFVGEWFEGYHEFHWSNLEDGSKGVVVWDDVKGHFYLSPDQTRALFTEITRILLHCYNAATLEQIFPWHHAAGDFIVRCEDNQIDVRLVSVRQYAPYLEWDEAERDLTENAEIRMVEALVIFFINLSIRMRLDRLDGIGDMIWADGIVVKSFVEGFLEGLAEPRFVRLLKAPTSVFQEVFLALDREDLMGIALQILGAYHPDAPDMPVIQTNLMAHLAELREAVQAKHPSCGAS